MSRIVSSTLGQGLLRASRLQALLGSQSRLMPSCYNYFSSLAAQGHQHHHAQTKAAATATSLTKSSLPIVNRNFFRGLFDGLSLGLDKFEEFRTRRVRLFDETDRERYIERLSDFLSSDESKSVIKDDIINLMALADNEQHLDLIDKMVISMNDGQNMMGAWGSALMRLYYLMNQVDRAYNNIMNIDQFGEFFDQRTTYKMAMTMLFNAGRYEHVLDLYKLSLERGDSLKASSHITNRQLSVLAFASYAKINTPEALEEAQKLFALDPNNPNLRMRVVTCLAYMAFKQDKPALALNVLSDSQFRNYVSVRELKSLNLCKLKRYEDIIFHLRDSMNELKRERKVMLKEVYELIMSNIHEIEDDKTSDALSQLLAEIKESDLVDETTTLDSLIFKPITVTPKPQQAMGYERNDVRNDRQFRGPRSQSYGRNERNYNRNERNYNQDRNERNYNQDRNERNYNQDRRERQNFDAEQSF